MNVVDAIASAFVYGDYMINGKWYIIPSATQAFIAVGVAELYPFLGGVRAAITFLFRPAIMGASLYLVRVILFPPFLILFRARYLVGGRWLLWVSQHPFSTTFSVSFPVIPFPFLSVLRRTLYTSALIVPFIAAAFLARFAVSFGHKKIPLLDGLTGDSVIKSLLDRLSRSQVLGVFPHSPGHFVFN